MIRYELAQLKFAIMKEPLESPTMADFVVLWCVPRGHRPTVTEAAEKLALLRADGPTADAFTFRDAFAPPDAQCEASPFGFGDECPAM